MVVMVLLLIPMVAQAEDEPSLRFDQKWYLTFGAFFPNINTIGRVDSKVFGIGTTLDFESDLGLDESKTLPILGLTYRTEGRSRWNFFYYDLERSGQTRLGIDIQWEDQIFSFGTDVESFMDTEIFWFNYGYSLYETEKSEFGLSAGLHITKVSAGIRLLDGSVDEAEAVTAPLPVFGLYGAHAFADKWLVRGRIGVFRLEIDDYEGSIDNVSFHLEHRTFENVGFGVGYNYFDIDITSEDEDWTGLFRWTYKGPVAYAFAYF